jgi:hypothetical protein
MRKRNLSWPSSSLVIPNVVGVELFGLAKHEGSGQWTQQIIIRAEIFPGTVTETRIVLTSFEPGSLGVDCG